MNKHLIAVVDDEQDLLDNFRALLEDQFEVASFSSPSDFLKNLPDLERRNCRLLVSDYKMPGMTGLEMIQKAHETLPELPFVILSGFLDKKSVLAAVNMGAFRLLEKPYSPEDLLTCIDQLIIETELNVVRREIRTLTSQLRELYSSVRLLLSQYIPPDVAHRIVLDAPNGQSEEGFEDLLEKLEHRLDHLLKTEKVINDLKQTHSSGNNPED